MEEGNTRSGLVVVAYQFWVANDLVRSAPVNVLAISAAPLIEATVKRINNSGAHRLTNALGRVVGFATAIGASSLATYTCRSMV